MRTNFLRAARALGSAAFAPVMATAIVSTAAERYRLHALSLALLAIAVLLFSALLVLFVTRLLVFRAEVAADWRHPRSAFGFLTFTAGSAVLGERLDEVGATGPALALIGVAIVSWAVLAYGVQLRLTLARDKPLPAEAINGGWLLWVVATQSLATAAAMVGVHERGLAQVAAALAVSAWAAGALLYVVLVTLLLGRLLLLPVAAADLEPGYWISMGATAITVLAGARILNLPHEIPIVSVAAPTLIGISLMLWSFGTWMLPFLVAIGIWRHLPPDRVRLGYEGALWSMVFPLGMYAAASAEFGGAAHLPLLVDVGGVAAYVAILAWLAVGALWLRSALDYFAGARA